MHQEMTKINNFVQNKVSPPTYMIELPQIGVAPMNDYNTKGLFDMAIPTLFMKWNVIHGQQQQKTICIDQYSFHLMQYHDNRFNIHPRFYYFIYNLVMHHHSQASVVVFVKKSQENNIPTTIEYLHYHLQNFPLTSYKSLL
jgi:hypothetical protein